jgi:hypothetical protein
VLPENLILPLQQQMSRAKALHDRDLAEGFGEVWLPAALSVKYPRAARAWGWQWVFPSPTKSADPRSGVVRRHHLNEASIQKAVATAARRARIVKPCSPHLLRHYSESGNIPRQPCRWCRAASGKTRRSLGIFSPATLCGVTGDDRDSDIRGSTASGGRWQVPGVGAAPCRADAGSRIRAGIGEGLDRSCAGFREVARPARDLWPERRDEAR